MIKKSELDIKKNMQYLSKQEVQELLEYQDTFLKFLNICIQSIQMDLYNLKMAGKEGTAYTSIEAILKIQKDLKSLEKSYKDLIESK